MTATTTRSGNGAARRSRRRNAWAAASTDRYLDHPSRRAYIAEHVDPLTEERIELDVPSDGTHGPSVFAW